MASVVSIARASTPDTPQMLKPLAASTVARIADALVQAAQEIDPAAGGVIFPLSNLPDYLQARARFIARGAVRHCHDQVARDAELKARAAVAEMLYQREFTALNSREQARCFHIAKAATQAYQRHLEGIGGELLPSEREALLIPGEGEGGVA